MNKIHNILIAGSLLAGLLGFWLMPALVFAGDVVPKAPTPGDACKMRTAWPSANVDVAANQKCPAKGENAQLNTAKAVCCVFDSLVVITTWVFFALIIITVLFGIVGAIFIITAGGDPAKVTTGRNFIVYAVVGFVAAMLVRAVPGFALAVTGM